MTRLIRSIKAGGSIAPESESSPSRAEFDRRTRTRGAGIAERTLGAVAHGATVDRERQAFWDCVFGLERTGTWGAADEGPCTTAGGPWQREKMSLSWRNGTFHS
jgi:hypothetical protein